MAKATHQGHCQVCGHKQKLPDGRLSKHGYTVRWGFFSGECFGTGALPFEQDISLIERAIQAAQERSAALRKRAAELEASRDPNAVVLNAYESNWARWCLDRSSGYRRIAGRVEMTTRRLENGYELREFYFICNTLRSEYRDRLNFACMGNTIESVVEHLNKYEAIALRKTADEADQYVKWQQARINGWQPMELIPIEAKVTA